MFEDALRNVLSGAPWFFAGMAVTALVYRWRGYRIVVRRDDQTDDE